MYIISSFLKHSIFKLEFVMMAWNEERGGERENGIEREKKERERGRERKREKEIESEKEREKEKKRRTEEVINKQIVKIRVIFNR